MASDAGAGRRVGILLLMQMASALILPFVLTDALARGYPEFLGAAAESATLIRIGIGLALFGAGLTLLLAVEMFPVLRRHGQRAAFWFLAVCTVSGALDLAHNAGVISMLSAAERSVSTGGDAVIQAWAAAAASFRRSAHIVQLVAIGAWMMTFYLSLWFFRLIPRPFSALGILGVASQFTGVTAMMILGYPVLGYLAMPLAPIHAATAIWLIVKGFADVPDNETNRFTNMRTAQAG